MISSETLALAVQRGLLSPEQAIGLRTLEAERAPAAATAHKAAQEEALQETPDDDEKLRFISGFGDIFVTIGLALFMGAFGYFSFRYAGAGAMWGAIAALAWGLAEFFTRIRRMALPSIVLLVVFAAAAFLAIDTLAMHSLAGAGATRPDFRGSVVLELLDLEIGQPLVLAVAALATALLVAAHYARFGVPITVAAGAAALGGAGLALLYALAPAFTARAINGLVLALGLTFFALAMRFDVRDPRRATRQTDIAFWLHLLAAPMIVHPLITALFGRAKTLDSGQASGILAIFLLLGLVAVLVDRRAMLVSGLTYAGVAFATLLSGSTLADMTLPTTLLSLGAFVLLLSAGWRPLRSGLLARLPAGLSARLPKPTTSTGS